MGVYVGEMLGLTWELGLVLVDPSRRTRVLSQHPCTTFVGGSYRCK